MPVEGLLGKKLGMAQTFEPSGIVLACTVLEVGPCIVTQVRTKERDGYEAVQLGYGAKKRLNEPEKGHLKAANAGNLRHLREFKADNIDDLKVGQKLGLEMFKVGDLVDVTGISKGRGFAGVVKRHGFHGGPKTHGQSDRHRAPGSIGSGTTPGRVLKGLKMAGHMGSKQVTTKNLRVVETNPARGILIVNGPVPGAADGLIKIRRAKVALPKQK
ncbi:MAG: 50S ribosomal protein L3 [Chloroflexi bacterium]|nr:50S ribosomal protein L3 [Chloroflexota bacterium]